MIYIPYITSDCCRLDDYVSLHYLLKHMAHLYLNDPFADGNSPSDIKGDIDQRADDPTRNDQDIKLSQNP